MIIAARTGTGAALASRLKAAGHTVITAGRKSPDDSSNHLLFDAESGFAKEAAFPEKLDGAVYCPGTITLRPFKSLKDDDFLHDYTVNCLGAVRALRALYPALKKAEHTASAVLFSTVAVQTGMPYHTSVASAKGAIEGLVRSLAAEWAPGIRVNAVAPSLTVTPLSSPLTDSDEKQKRSADRHPLKRLGSVNDVAEAAQFLLCDANWMTGQVLHVDGGMGDLRLL